MGHRKKHAPRHGSLAFLPRKRAASIKGHLRHWQDNVDEINFLGFAGFKAGMTHITYIEDQKNSPYFGKELMKPVTVIEVPPIVLIGIRVYNEDDYGKYALGELMNLENNNYLTRKINVPNPENYNFEEKKEKLIKSLNHSSEIRGLFQTQPHLTTLPRKNQILLKLS
jgi:large subunit ribosomal protein L3